MLGTHEVTILRLLFAFLARPCPVFINVVNFGTMDPVHVSVHTGNHRTICWYGNFISCIKHLKIDICLRN